MQHREQGGHADSGADEHDRPLALVKGEQSSRGTDLQPVADADVLSDVVPGDAVRFDLDRDSVAGIAR